MAYHVAITVGETAVGVKSNSTTPSPASVKRYEGRAREEQPEPADTLVLTEPCIQS